MACDPPVLIFFAAACSSSSVLTVCWVIDRLLASCSYSSFNAIVYLVRGTKGGHWYCLCSWYCYCYCFCYCFFSCGCCFWDYCFLRCCVVSNLKNQHNTRFENYTVVVICVVAQFVGVRLIGLQFIFPCEKLQHPYMVITAPTTNKFLEQARVSSSNHSCLAFHGVRFGCYLFTFQGTMAPAFKSVVVY